MKEAGKGRVSEGSAISRER